MPQAGKITVKFGIMPIFYQQDLDAQSSLAVWKIEEEEAFFSTVPLQREITHEHKRKQHRAGRFLLKHLRPDFPLELIRIADTRKPFLQDEAYHFSISHCEDYAAVILSPHRRVGLDIELISPKVERISTKFLNEEELARLPEKDRLRNLTLRWSAKEAVFKWWSHGGVDFKTDIVLSEFSMEEGGALDLKFRGRPLRVGYKWFGDLCLAWLNEEGM